MEASEQKSVLSFPCSGCGGPMLFHAEGQNLKCQYCGKEDPIEDVQLLPTEYELLLSESESVSGVQTDWGFQKQTIHCETCGGETVIPKIETAALCVFCGSSKVLTQEDTASIRPETVIPFQLSKDKAVASFMAWRKKRWFVPNAFKKDNIVSQLVGVYIPYWTFDSQTESVYTAERGDYHYRTVTRTRMVNGKRETYTTQERYTVWRRVAGEHDRWFDDVLIPASSRYDSSLLDNLDNFDLRQLKSYKPDYLSGYAAEKYTITRKEGWRQAEQEMDSILRSEIRRKIGGDEIRGLHVRTQHDNMTYKHILLPLWNANYKYRNKPYRYMVNGQTGAVSGTVPRSPWKITFAVLCGIVVIAALLILVNYAE